MSEQSKGTPNLPAGVALSLEGAVASGMMAEAALVHAGLFSIARALAWAAAREDAAEEERVARERNRHALSVDVREL
jgi:hypothetical protein